MSGFSYRKNIDGSSQAPTNKGLIGAASVVFQVGDLIRVNQAGRAALLTTGDVCLGVVTGVSTKDGVPLTPDAGTLDTYTMGSDNVSNAAKQYVVHYIPALANYLFYNDADSDMTVANLFQFMAVSDENNVHPATVSDTVLDTVRLIELDPDGDADASKGLFQIVESFWAQNAGGTVDTSGIEA
jgi:hypothetical protein